MTAEYIEPLNLQYIFQNILAGSPDIFFALFLIIFSILAGTFKMNGSTYLILYALSSIMLYSWFSGGLFLLVMFIGGLLIFFTISKIIKN